MRGRLARLLVVLCVLTMGLVAGRLHPANASVVPRLTVGDVTVAEGDSGKIAVQVPIDLSVPAPTAIYVHWKVTGGTATPRVDFVAPLNLVRTGTLKIAAGATNGVVTVNLFGDTSVELDETVNVDVTSAAGVTIEKSHGTLTIQNDDVAAPAVMLTAAVLTATIVPRVSVGTPVVTEGDSSTRAAPVPVTLSVPAPATIKVSFTTPGTDVLAGDPCNDITTAVVSPTTVTVTFLAGQQSKRVPVKVRGNLAANKQLMSPDSVKVVSGTADVAIPTSQITVLDDDRPNTTATMPAPGTYRVSETADGSDPTFPSFVANLTGCGYPSSQAASVSADGRYVAFTSNADNLVGNDSNGYPDAFVKDTWTGSIQRVSVSSDGAQGNGTSQVETMSADGRFVTFRSDANNLVPDDDNGFYDSFLYDRVTGVVQRLGNVHTPHTPGSLYASLSADGRYVAYDARIDATCWFYCAIGAFVLDRSTDTTTLVSTGPNGPPQNVLWPSISGDGRHVAFINNELRADVYVKDIDSGNLEMVSVNNAGDPGTGTWGTYMNSPPSLSNDGQAVLFTGQYCNMGLPSLPCGDGTGSYIQEAWVRNRASHTTVLASVGPNSAPSPGSQYASLSSSGRYVIFGGGGTGWGSCAQVWERDLATATTRPVDLLDTGQCPYSSYIRTNDVVSLDGSTVVYTAMPSSGNVSATNPETVYIARLP